MKNGVTQLKQLDKDLVFLNFSASSLSLTYFVSLTQVAQFFYFCSKLETAILTQVMVL